MAATRSSTPASQTSGNSDAKGTKKANSLETAQTAIKNLDRMIAGMRQRRADCGNQIEEDTNEIARIDKEVAEISTKIDKISASREERKKRRDELHSVLTQHMGLMQQVGLQKMYVEVGFLLIHASRVSRTQTI